MAGERFRHIFLQGPTRTQGFTNPRRGGPFPHIPARDPTIHSHHLRRRLEDAWATAEQKRQAVAHVEKHGAYLDFISEPGFDLMLKSLEARRSRIKLLNVRREGPEGKEQTMATVYLPFDKRGYFLRKINSYSEESVTSGRRKNEKLVNSISDIRLSVLESFWQDDPQLLPGDAPVWIEVWLSSDNDDVIERFTKLLAEENVEMAQGNIKFPERAVVLILVDRLNLVRLIELSDDIAELRLGKELASFFLEMENAEQVERVHTLLSRTDMDESTNVFVCLLDTGVNNGHMLIRPLLSDDDVQTVIESWGANDHNGHGTLMAGTAAYGDLLDALTSTDRIRIGHRLESVKILPPPPAENPHWLWGYLTAEGIYLAEMRGPRRRVICLAVTSTDFRDRGKPSSWSGKLDELTSGYEDEQKRLLIVSAGNVDDANSWRRYFADNLTNEVHDPGQSWNALTVGAYTTKVSIRDPSLAGYSPIAPQGGLSPYSTTSTTWPARKWPIKPEVLFEGGNVARGPNDSIFDTEDLKLLSTSHNPSVRQFAPFFATSAAAALASQMAARIQAMYPSAWPETVRALIVHTAEWTQEMRQQFLRDESKASYRRLLRICGYGVPNIDTALYCATNSLTLISQAELQPYDRRGQRYVSRDMHLYSLPWPSESLIELGETQIRMRVTLSYFVEPGPGEVGWQDRYRYASHALRFVVNGPNELEDEFVRRVNLRARENGDHPGTEGPGDKWLIGGARDVGSIHSDIWHGTAAELSQSNLIAVYPAIGWWRERHHLDRWSKRCRYSLVVSIISPETEVDIYTPVATKVGVLIQVDIPRI